MGLSAKIALALHGLNDSHVYYLKLYRISFINPLASYLLEDFNHLQSFKFWRNRMKIRPLHDRVIVTSQKKNVPQLVVL